MDDKKTTWAYRLGYVAGFIVCACFLTIVVAFTIKILMHLF